MVKNTLSERFLLMRFFPILGSTRYGSRTRVSTVKGWRLNRLPNRAYRRFVYHSGCHPKKVSFRRKFLKNTDIYHSICRSKFLFNLPKSKTSSVPSQIKADKTLSHPYQIRTGVSCVRGRYPKPLDEGA